MQLGSVEDHDRRDPAGKLPPHRVRSREVADQRADVLNSLHRAAGSNGGTRKCSLHRPVPR